MLRDHSILPMLPNEIWKAIFDVCDYQVISDLLLVDQKTNLFIKALFTNLKLTCFERGAYTLHNFFENYRGVIKKLNLENNSKQLFNNTLGIIFNNYKELQTINLRGCECDFDITFPSLPALRSFSAVDSHITENGFKKLIQSAPNLTKLDIGRTRPNGSNVFSNQDFYILENTNLEVLNLQGLSVCNYSDRCPDFIKRLPKTIRELYLSEDPKILEMVKDVFNKNRLSVLSIKSSWSKYKLIPLDKDSSGLQSFSCVNAAPDKELLAYILQKNLRDLVINIQYYRLNSILIPSLLINIQNHNLNNFFTILQKNCPRLKKLEVLCADMTQLDEFEIAESFLSLKTLKLSLAKESNVALERLLQKCPHIREFHLRNFSRPVNMQENQPALLLPRNTYLQKFVFSTQIITTQALDAVIESYPNLYHLDIAHVRITSDTLQYVLDRFVKLGEINIRGISDQVVLNLLKDRVEQLDHFKKIFINASCPETIIRLLQERHPHLVIERLQSSPFR